MDALTLYDKIKISNINIGSGGDVPISKLAEIIRRIIGFGGELKYASSMPDGTPQKLLDISRIKSLGWEPLISFSASSLSIVNRRVVNRLTSSKRPAAKN